MRPLDSTIDNHDGDLTITGRTEITGLVDGRITVPAGATLILGVLATARTVTVELEGRADIHGTVHGDITVQTGGWLNLYGKVDCSIQNSPRTRDRANAVLLAMRLELIP